MIIDIFSVSDKNPLDIIYVMLNSIKKCKDEETTVHYHLIIEDCDDAVKEYFSDLVSDDFYISFIEARNYEQCINPPDRSYLYYMRCLAPFIFKDISKILYLDTDVVMVSNRLEELWNTDLENYYLAGAIDIEESLRDEAERINVGKNQPNNTYFNSGVLIFNLDKIRKDGYDEKLCQYLLKYPEGLQCILQDQTLLNWLFKDNVKIISTDFNNSILSMIIYDTTYYQTFYNTRNLLEKLETACLLHFKGHKVWKPLVDSNQKKYLPNYTFGRIIYLNLYNQFSKKGIKKYEQ